MTHWAKMVDITDRTLSALRSDPKRAWTLEAIVELLKATHPGIEVDASQVRDAIMRLASRSLLIYGPDRHIHVDQRNLKRYAPTVPATF